MEIDTPIDFKKDDLIYKIFDENNGINTKIYRIISITNEFYGSSLEKFLSRDTAVIIPKDETSTTDFAEILVIQTVLDGKTLVYAKHV